jgi:hypothetical protein
MSISWVSGLVSPRISQILCPCKQTRRIRSVLTARRVESAILKSEREWLMVSTKKFFPLDCNSGTHSSLCYLVLGLFVHAGGISLFNFFVTEKPDFICQSLDDYFPEH